MDEQQPRPPRNWRGYVKEYVIIVVGVLTALAAQQAMEWWNWQSDVAQARQAIATELAGAVHNSIVRLRTKSCTDRRLDELAVILDTASEHGRLPPVGAIGSPPRRRWSSGAWESVIASQVATHFPRQQLSDLGRLYTAIDGANDAAVREIEVWNILGTLVGPGRRLDPASEAELRKALSQARDYNRGFAVTSYTVLNIIRTLNPPYSKSDLAFIARSRDEDPMAPSRPVTMEYLNPQFLACQPLGAVPHHYGQMAVQDVPGVVESGLKLLPDTTKTGK
jgi:hypothetical protein